MSTHLESVIAPLSFEYRGRIIHETIMIEKHIEECLMSYFCKPNAKLEFASLILDRLNSDGKIAVLEQLVKNQTPDFNKKYKKLFGELRYIKDQRNIFAHHMLDIFIPEAETSKTTDVTLIDFRNKATYNTYSIDSYSKLIDRIKRCYDELVTLKMTLFS